MEGVYKQIYCVIYKQAKNCKLLSNTKFNYKKLMYPTTYKYIRIKFESVIEIRTLFKPQVTLTPSLASVS